MRDPRSRILLTAGYVLAVSVTGRDAWYRVAILVAVPCMAMAAWRVSPGGIVVKLLPMWGIAGAALLGTLFGASWREAVWLSIRLILISGAGVILGSSMPVTRLLAGFRALGMPATIVSMLLLTSRYVHVIAAEVLSVRRAWLSRSAGSFRLRYVVSLGHASVALTQRAPARSERIAWAMVSRGFRGQIPCPPLGRPAGKEIAATAIGLTLLVAVVFL